MSTISDLVLLVSRFIISNVDVSQDVEVLPVPFVHRLSCLEVLWEVHLRVSVLVLVLLTRLSVIRVNGGLNIARWISLVRGCTGSASLGLKIWVLSIILGEEKGLVFFVREIVHLRIVLISSPRKYIIIICYSVKVNYSEHMKYLALCQGILF